jgi:FkbM family methyltransferase
MLCARAVQPGGVVHLFEPQPDLCTRILESLCSVPEPVVLHELGLMDHDGRLDLFQVSGHSGRASFVPDGSAPAGAVVHARVCNAATYVPPLLRGGSWAAKVDVEGAERHVVPLLLELPGLRFVAFEVSHQRDPGPLWDAVASKGLALFGMVRSRFAAQLDPVASAGEMSRYEDLLVASLRPGVRIARRCSPRDLAEFVVPREPAHLAEDPVAPRRARGRG